MRSGASTASFVLFVIVLLGALYWVLHQRGHAQWALVGALLGILVLRGGLFLYNLRQQRKRIAEGGRPRPQVQQRLGLDFDEEEPKQDPNDLP
jgi:hypothetical protein